MLTAKWTSSIDWPVRSSASQDQAPVSYAS
jgi:hypothetical protein